MKTETKKCSSCGEPVLSTEKFCKNCGKAIEQKRENDVVVENPNKKFILTFEALEQGIKGAYSEDIKIVYSIEVDGKFIGKVKPGEKIETFVTKGRHNVVLKLSKGFFTKVENTIWVKDNQTVLLSVSGLNNRIQYCINPSDAEKEEIRQKAQKSQKKASRFWWIFWGVLTLFWVIRYFFFP